MSANPQDNRHDHVEDLFVVEQKVGDPFFAFVLLAVAVLLLAQIGEQTKWVNNLDWTKQPRFWPAVCLTGLLVFSLANFITSWLTLRQQAKHPMFPVGELLGWLKTLEYAAYFMLYVFSVPYLGYLTATILFCSLLCLRAGYRELKFFFIAIVVAIAIVLIFKSFLQVKIPGGELYNYLPSGLRNFMITYF